MKKQGNIIIVEGIWGAGKTTFIKKLSKRLRAIRIPEPDHRSSGRIYPKAITRWYFNAHHRNIDRALAQARKGRTVLVERSVLSSAIFSVLYLNKKNYQSDINKFKKQFRTAAKEKIGCRIVYLSPRSFSHAAAVMRRKPYLKAFAEEKFLIAFDRLLKKMVKDFMKR